MGASKKTLNEILENRPDETCPACVGAMRIIAGIEEILTHLDAKAAEPEALMQPPCQALPQRGLFDERG